MFKKAFALAILFSIIFQVQANEGMWLPLLIKRLNHVDMQKMGLQLTAEEIYSVNQSSLKDAIVVLNGGSCTAEMISKEGLMLSNHHCAFGVIQQHSSTEKDYLTDGFWAMDRSKELQAEGMTAGFLIRMEDVTSKVLANVTNEMSEQDRKSAIRTAMSELKKEAVGDTHFDVQIKSFFEGNEFYLFVYEIFRDVRLVGAPPSSIGKFGGDTDNWMWPRQTGDFSMLRVYADESGRPADYSASNKPYKPKHHLPVSIAGIKKNDFAMVMGYPGSTDRYLCSYGVKLATTLEQPAIVKIRGERLKILNTDMDASDKVRIQYASKYARVANYYKYFKGQTLGLKKLRVQNIKKAEEDEFTAWLKKDAKRKEQYGNAIPLLEKGYAELTKYKLSQTYLNECLFGAEVTLFSFRASRLSRALENENPDKLRVNRAVKDLKERAETFFKDYNPATDQKVFAALLEMYYNDIPTKMHGDVFQTIEKKFKGDFRKYAKHVFSKSIFTDQGRFDKFISNPKIKILKKDPAYIATNSFISNYRSNVSPVISDLYVQIEKGSRLYIKGMREMNPSKNYYPNANSSMRLSYGKVAGYKTSDNVFHDYYTTLSSLIEKEDPKNDEFIVPPKLHELYNKKDFGQYASDGVMPVCFITDNDITGGNSGSPVINGKGELIGCAFDGNWEAMSGDIAFEHNLQRCIVADIRYILFVVEKYAGAGHLVKEMTIVK